MEALFDLFDTVHSLSENSAVKEKIYDGASYPSSSLVSDDGVIYVEGLFIPPDSAPTTEGLFAVREQPTNKQREVDDSGRVNTIGGGTPNQKVSGGNNNNNNNNKDEGSGIGALFGLAGEVFGGYNKYRGHRDASDTYEQTAQEVLTEGKKTAVEEEALLRQKTEGERRKAFTNTASVGKESQSGTLDSLYQTSIREAQRRHDKIVEASQKKSSELRRQAKAERRSATNALIGTALKIGGAFLG